MPKLPVINSKKILVILKKNGFEIDNATGSHYILYNKVNKKRVTVPFHNKDLPKGTLLSIIKSAGLSREDFK
jgi:predicted RNA binding protein YcfA (HicA-like mRNA interferase family)